MAAKQMSMSLTLLVDKARNKVIYAESGKDFIETLLSFLTMPLGTAIKLSGKQSNMGSLTMLYQSLEDLDLELLNTKSCKDMLLHPKSSAEELCRNLPLIVNIGAIKPTQYYACKSWRLGDEEHYLVSTVENARCRCGATMDFKFTKKNGPDVDANGVFIKGKMGKMGFMIRDDLQVSVVSSTASFALLRELGISDASVLEKRNVNVGEEEVLHLLTRLLLSKTPLTDVFLGELTVDDGVDLYLKVIARDFKEMVQPKTEKKICNDSRTEKKICGDSRKMIVKLFQSKLNNKVLYAEGGEEFADLLFSFLAFPLGSIVKCLGGRTSMGCLDNLYKSVEDLNIKDCMKSEERRAMLLDPKLAPYFGTKNQLLQIEEQVPCPMTVTSRSIQLSTMNQKFPDALTELGGSFVAGPAMFMVTDELVVKPLSPILGISLLSNFNIPVSDIEEQIVCMGEKEAMSLLRASLISNSVLSDVFYHKKPRQMLTKPKEEDFSAHDFI